MENYEKMQKDPAAIRFIRQWDPDYPQIFQKLPRMPKGFYVYGNLPDPSKKSVAIVGARGCTAYGRGEALHFGEVLSAHGVQVISGLAAGIDSWAQDGAVRGGTPTFSVVGTGADVCYPKSSRILYRKILQSGGGILSEFEPGDPPYAWHFPLRNRLISALADLVLVIEARMKSGSLITVDYAIEQGKDVFAVPGRTQDVLSQGCNRLIAQGAGIAWNPEVVLEALGITDPVHATCETRKEERKLPKAWDHAQDFRRVYALLSQIPVGFDELQRQTGLPVGQLSSVLMQLCMSGYVEEAVPGHYTKK